MPFPWQTTGSLGGGIPNQLSSRTPQNNEGLGVPWGQAMFNLPRYQMPGMDLNFNGNMGMSQGMSGGQVPVGGIQFNMTRQASSDPVQNIIQDIQNPLGGMKASFGPAQAQPAQPLKEKMTLRAAPVQNYDPFGGTALAEGMATNFAEMNRVNGGPNAIPYNLREQYAATNSPFSLRARMLGNPLPEMVFM